MDLAAARMPPKIPLDPSTTELNSMFDLFKGAAVTLLVWVLTVSVTRELSGAFFFWGLPLTSFVLPLLLPNGRWLFGGAAFATAIVVLAHADSDRSLGAAIGLFVLGSACAAMFLGIAARYTLRALRAWYRRRTNAPPLPEKTLPPIACRSVMLTVGGGLALLAAYAVFVMYSAGASAEQIAAERPYCIQIASGGRFRSVRSRLELLGFYMMSNGSVRHAVLAVKNGSVLETYHWSYKNNVFAADEYGPQPVHCVVATDFLRHPR
jgi:hypothetical protein